MEKKTAEEILSEYYEEGALNGEDHVIIAAMEEYAAQQTASLQSSLSEKEAEIEKLNNLVDTMKKGILKGDHLYGNLVFDNEEKSPLMKQAEEIERLRGALKEIRDYDGVNSHHVSWGDVVTHLQKKADKALQPSKENNP
jgi:hypothetical protein